MLNNLKFCWVRMGPNPKMCVLRRGEKDRRHGEEIFVKTEADTEVMQLSTKGHLRIISYHQKLGESQGNTFSLGASR
jgi:hypothetical protein